MLAQDVLPGYIEELRRENELEKLNDFFKLCRNIARSGCVMKYYYSDSRTFAKARQEIRQLRTNGITIKLVEIGLYTGSYKAHKFYLCIKCTIKLD
jgi:hypothetical protein